MTESQKRLKKNEEKREGLRRFIIFACIWIIIAIVATLYVCGAFAPEYMKEAPESKTYIVKSGDVLWSIADDYCPEGMSILIGEEHLFYYGALPYDDYPIVQMVCREVPGQFFGESVIKSLIPIQRTLNAVENDVIDILNRAALGNVIAEEGSIDTDDYEENGLEPGRVLYYRQGYSKPEFGSISTLPSGIVAERDYLINAMEYVAGVSQLMVTGSTPSGITSGTAISNLMEIDNTRLSLTGENQRNCVKKLGKKWLRIYKKFGVGRRIIDCVGVNDIGSAFIWSGEDINSFDIEFTVENELIESEDMRRQRYLEAYNMGLFTDENGKIPERHKKKAIECLRVSSFDELMSIGVLHIQKAQRENNFFLLIVYVL